MINKVFIEGRVAVDVELKQGPPRGKRDGKYFTRFLMVHNAQYGHRRHAAFFFVVAFGRLAKHIVQGVGKGDLISIEGRLEHTPYKVDGQEQYRVCIIAEQLHRSETPQRQVQRKARQADNKELEHDG